MICFKDSGFGCKRKGPADAAAWLVNITKSVGKNWWATEIIMGKKINTVYIIQFRIYKIEHFLMSRKLIHDIIE